jgi:hypothetical protein
MQISLKVRSMVKKKYWLEGFFRKMYLLTRCFFCCRSFCSPLLEKRYDMV